MPDYSNVCLLVVKAEWNEKLGQCQEGKRGNEERWKMSERSIARVRLYALLFRETVEANARDRWFYHLILA